MLLIKRIAVSVFLLFSGAIAPPAFSQQPSGGLPPAAVQQPAGVQLEQQLKEIKTNLVQKVTKAFQGDTQIQQELLRSYLAPFFLMLAVMFVCYIVANNVGKIVGEIVAKRVDLTLGRFLAKAVRIGLMLVVAMVILEYNGISVSGFAAIIAAMGFAIGLALQGTLSHFAAGIMLLLFRPFKVEDTIVVGGVEGKVEEIDLFTTRINTGDNRHIIIPNGEIFGNRIENVDRNSTRRVEIVVNTTYAAEMKLTRKALAHAIQMVEEITEIKEPKVELSELGTHGLVWRIKVWTHPKNMGAVKEMLTEAAKNALDAYGILIPFPQMDVHVGGRLQSKAG